MRQTRRTFLATSSAIAGGVAFLPFAARAAGHASDVFDTPGGQITVHPIRHASFVMETPVGVVYCDPVGDPAQYADLPAPDLIMVTHHHGDHFNAGTLAAIMGEGTKLITNPTVYDALEGDLKAKAESIGNGDETAFNGVSIDAIPAYNTTAGKEKFHPRGRDNGYIFGFDGFRIYVSGDTEDTAEMRALEGIDLAFVCMNLPFTMDVNAAASAVAEFKPTYVYPYHYHGRDGGTQDPADFAKLVDDAVKVKLANWY